MSLGGNNGLYTSVLSKWLINSILWHFKMNADISILEKSVILRLPFCVFVGYSVLTYANDALTYWLPDRTNNPLDLESFFVTGYVEYYLKCTKVCKIFRLLLFTAVSIESSQFLSMWMTSNHLRINS